MQKAIQEILAQDPNFSGAFEIQTCLDAEHCPEINKFFKGIGRASRRMRQV